MHTVNNQGAIQPPRCLPTHSPDRRDLVTRIARLALNIESAEIASDAAAIARQSAEYHRAMAELLARTASDSREGQAKIEWARRDHLRQAEAHQHELEQLEGQEA